MLNATIIISEEDYQSISNLIQNTKLTTRDLLEEELSRATIVPAKELPMDVVSINSQIKFIDLESKKESVVTLTLPKDASIEEGKVSILAPIGAALIGLRVGQQIKWPLPNGRFVTLEVLNVFGK